jgi:hypothetical protein
MSEDDKAARSREAARRYRARKRGEAIPKLKTGRPRSYGTLELDLKAVRAEIDAWWRKTREESARGIKPDETEWARLSGREGTLMCALENADGRRYHVLGPPLSMRPHLGPAILWKPRASQILYLGQSRPGTAQWQFNVTAPAWEPYGWEPGQPYREGSIYVQAEPGRRAFPGEWVSAIQVVTTLNEYGARDFVTRALFGQLELLARPDELPELAGIIRGAAQEPTLTPETRHRELLEDAANKIEEFGRVHLADEGEEG